MKYGYVRVSTKEQNIDRQLADMYTLGLTDLNKGFWQNKLSKTKKHLAKWRFACY